MDGTPRTTDRATLVAAVVIAVALAILALVAYLLADSQREQRRDIRSSYGQRAEIAAGTIDAIFAVAFAGQAREAAETLDQSVPSRELLDAQAREAGTVYTAVLDASGEVLGASSAVPGDLAARAGRVPGHVRSALRAGSGLSDVRVEGGRAVVETAIAFESPFGRRVLLSATPTETYVAFLSGTLARLPRYASARAWVLDANGRVLGRAGAARLLRIPSPQVRGPARTGTFVLGGEPTFFQTEPLPRSRWRVAVVAPEKELFSSISGTSRWLPWALLALGALALVTIVLLGRRLARTAARLRGSNEDLARSNADLEQFAYVASHDLSEPLRTVAGFSQLLGSRYAGRLDAEADLYIEHMGAGVERMQQLIDDLLLYARVGRAPVGRRPVDLDELLGEVLASIEPVIRERDAQITSEGLPVVAGERVQLGQVLQNLLANAVKFTAAGVRPVILLTAERRDGMWEVAVRDNGIGVAADEDVIFKMFGRLHPADAYPGTGIGLALVKRILERHGGDIWVTSAPGGGSIFTFTLPDHAPVPAPAPVAAHA